MGKFLLATVILDEVKFIEVKVSMKSSHPYNFVSLWRASAFTQTLLSLCWILLVSLNRVSNRKFSIPQRRRVSFFIILVQGKLAGVKQGAPGVSRKKAPIYLASLHKRVHT